MPSDCDLHGTSSCAHRSCQQEADAAHPAPARGRGKRNAGESGMPAGSGSCPSGASLGAVEAKCEQEAERRSRKCRPIVTCMEQVPVLTVHASRKRTPPIQRQLGGGGSGMLVKAECQQEVEAAHPAPAWGRWKRNASTGNRSRQWLENEACKTCPFK